MMKERNNFIDQFAVKGYVHWEITDENGKVKRRGEGIGSQWWLKWIPNFIRRVLPFGKQNAVVDSARANLATFMTGTSVTPPSYIMVGTGTDTVAGSDTGLQTPIVYTGSSYGKAINSSSVFSQWTARFIVSFATNEITTSASNIDLKEAGLFTGTAIDSGMWARVNIDVTKAPSENLVIYWYITFERRSGLAIKSGASIATTGNITQNTSSELAFASPVTIVTIHNDTGGRAYFKFNEALTGTPPTNFDLVLEDGQSWWLSEEEIEMTSIFAYVTSGNITMPSNTLSVRGW